MQVFNSVQRLKWFVNAVDYIMNSLKFSILNQRQLQTGRDNTCLIEVNSK